MFVCSFVGLFIYTVLVCSELSFFIISFYLLRATILQIFLDCGVTVQSGDVNDNDDDYKVANVLQRSPKEILGNRSWIPPNGQTGEFILKLGCKEDSYNVVQLVNTNLNKEYSTKRFKVLLR